MSTDTRCAHPFPSSSAVSPALICHRTRLLSPSVDLCSCMMGSGDNCHDLYANMCGTWSSVMLLLYAVPPCAMVSLLFFWARTLIPPCRTEIKVRLGTQVSRVRKPPLGGLRGLRISLDTAHETTLLSPDVKVLPSPLSRSD